MRQSAKREKKREKQFQLGRALAAREEINCLLHTGPGLVNETFTFVLIGRSLLAINRH